MKKKIFAVYDKEEDFACRLTSWFKQKCRLSLEFMAFTNPQKLCEYGKIHEIALVLAAENSLETCIRDAFQGKMIVLLEEGPSSLCDYPNISKYQSCTEILQELLTLMGTHSPSCIPETNARQNLELLGVYSPVNRCGKTSFALAASQILSERYPVLYLNLESCSGFESLFAIKYPRNLGDFFYHLRQKKENTTALLASLIHQTGTLHYIPPVFVPEDIWSVTEEEYDGLLQHIAGESNYHTVIIDFGENISSSILLLRKCRQIYMPILKDRPSAEKIQQYETCMKQSGEQEILEKTRKLLLPSPSSFTEPGNWPYGLTKGSFGEAVRKELIGKEHAYGNIFNP